MGILISECGVHSQGVLSGDIQWGTEWPSWGWVCRKSTTKDLRGLNEEGMLDLVFAKNSDEFIGLARCCWNSVV